MNDIGETFELCGYVCTPIRQMNDEDVERDTPNNVPVVHDRHSSYACLVHVMERPRDACLRLNSEGVKREITIWDDADDLVVSGDDNVTHRICDVTDRRLAGRTHYDLESNSSPFGVD